MSLNSQDPGTGAGGPGGVSPVSRIPGVDAGGPSMSLDG